jgi:hypothetical protein
MTKLIPISILLAAGIFILAAMSAVHPPAPRTPETNLAERTEILNKIKTRSADIERITVEKRAEMERDTAKQRAENDADWKRIENLKIEFNKLVGQ